MRFDLTDLRLFLNVHESGTITEAARRCHITTASASERIKGMEAVLGVLLLNRRHKGVQVTPAGRTLLHHASVVVQQMARMHSDLGQYGSGVKGHVRLLGNTSACNEYLPALLGTFLQQHPDISIDLEERTSTAITELIRQGMADIGLVADSAELDALQAFPIAADPLVVITCADFAQAIPNPVSLVQISHLDFVGLMAGSALQEHIATHSRQAGKHLHYRVRVRSIDAVCKMVGNGVGIAIVPLTAATRHQQALRLNIIALSNDWARRNLMLCVRDSEQLPAYVLALMRHILDMGPTTMTMIDTPLRKVDRK
ncbi:LysR family transcriptional regulator [Advenella sp. S44]|uniref:LysR family transcriptional regulator n=1 Tax=Advenella sp. S44 TaxID=1982755 RepID=UPI000C2AA91C|nr:LysR family transcriptional regulator [Advenella sp. S44]PJX23059.1 LysR family transcriptional regulator [Advenella sp. S44]